MRICESESNTRLAGTYEAGMQSLFAKRLERHIAKKDFWIYIVWGQVAELVPKHYVGFIRDLHTTLYEFAAI